eukprot:XP_019082120.1 PREDICTED: uncharacterized protein LOC100253596 isoform X4 [Vitis vinifera]
MDNANTRFDPDLIHAIFKLVWSRTALEREKNEGADPLECENKSHARWLMIMPLVSNTLVDAGRSCNIKEKSAHFRKIEETSMNCVKT